MARIVGGIGQNLSGTADGMVFVNRNGKTYMRSLPRPRKASEWSDKQRQARSGFAAVIRYARSHKKYVIAPIWNKAAQGMDQNGFNLFVSANRGAFDFEGKMGDPGLLHFSTGHLPLPFRLAAKVDSQNPESINVSWVDQLNDSAYMNDCLMAVTYKGIATAPVNTGFTRKDGHATLVNSTPEGEEGFLYLFFWNKKLDQYSADQAFVLS